MGEFVVVTSQLLCKIISLGIESECVQFLFLGCLEPSSRNVFNFYSSVALNQRRRMFPNMPVHEWQVQTNNKIAAPSYLTAGCQHGSGDEYGINKLSNHPWDWPQAKFEVNR